MPGLWWAGPGRRYLSSPCSGTGGHGICSERAVLFQGPARQHSCSKVSRQGIVRRGRASRPPQRLTSRVMSPLSAVGGKRTIAAPASSGPQTPRRHPVGVRRLVPQGRHPDDRFLHGSSSLIGKRKEALEIRVPLCTWYARLDSNQWPTESEFSGRQRKTRCGTRVSVGLHNYWRIFRKYPELLRCNGSGLFANSRQIVVR